jgi:glycosyltransferase involved in cell wall biosynthesis
MPAYNEAENLEVIVDQVLTVLGQLGPGSELIVVDDGSTDETRRVLAELRAGHGDLRSVTLRRNLGKSAAVAAGLRRAKGDVVVLMDADGQDQPHEIPRMVAAVEGGLDLVTGRRGVRRDRFVKRTTSRLYNSVTRAISGVPGTDFNSGFKAMRREVAESLDLYGELHRYIPVLAHWSGYRVGEIEVDHQPRLHGTSKFGIARFWRGLFDLVTVKFLGTYTSRPFHLFGGLGAFFGVSGALVLGWLTFTKITGHSIGDRPALLLGILLVVLSAQLLLFGLLAELVVHLAPRSVPPGEIDDP